tara:strand:+ start:49 stop:441 length:393 start_codon:yes stop_codon:yes gene_type:complete
MSDYKFELPIYIKNKKGKKISLSLNWYRNCHYHVSNDIKKRFKESIADQFEGLPRIEGRVRIKFVYYARINNSPDLDNFTSVVKKFFQDAMTELGLIEDDNVNFVVATSEYYGGIDKGNPRVDAFVTEIN